MTSDDRKQIPPSFTPQPSSQRPSSRGDAVPVDGSKRDAPNATAQPERRRTQRPETPAYTRGSKDLRENAAPSAQPVRRPVRVTSSNPAQDGHPPGAVPPARAAQPLGQTAVQPAGQPVGRGAGAAYAHNNGYASPGPGGPGHPGAPTATPRRRRRRRRPGLTILVLLLVLLLAWPIGLLVWANSKIQHVDALSSASATSGETYLLAGNDSREDGAIKDDGTEGARTDTIMLLHVPESGPTALISLPRDTYAEIPGHNPNKLNAAYALGAAPLLVEATEGVTGMKIDHFVEIGLGGVQNVVDSVGGLELCLDYAVKDKRSELTWKKPGCEQVDGKKALAFIRMRYSDPKGDIGRAERQRQLISSLTSTAADPAVLANPKTHVALIDAGLGSLTVDEDTGIIDLGKLALAFRRATGPDGVTGVPPIAALDYRPGGAGSTVLLDPDLAPQFFTDLTEGDFEPGEVLGEP